MPEASGWIFAIGFQSRIATSRQARQRKLAPSPILRVAVEVGTFHGKSIDLTKDRRTDVGASLIG
eukprot:scaffold194_cov277-Pinguiococcus_pyrenoidosus.AAC.3